MVAIKKHEKHTVVWKSFGFNLGGDPQVNRSRRPRIREGGTEVMDRHYHTLLY